MKLSEGNRMKLVLLKGEFPMFDFFYTDEDLDKVVNFEPRPGDLFLVTYPKCGTTWMQYIIWEILHDGAKPPSINQVMFEDIPFLELTGPSVLETLQPPRAFKSHMPYQFVPHGPQAKYIIVVRNPFDCCVSYFHHQRNVAGLKDLKFDEFFDHFVRGELPFGSYFDFLLSWLPHKDRNNVLWVNYEDMKWDIEAVILMVANFLGHGHVEKLVDDPDLFKTIVKHVDLSYMKENVPFYFSAVKTASREEYLELIRQRSFGDIAKDFLREGKVGGSRDYLTEEQKGVLAKQMKDKLKGTELENYWENYV